MNFFELYTQPSLYLPMIIGVSYVVPCFKDIEVVIGDLYGASRHNPSISEGVRSPKDVRWRVANPFESTSTESDSNY